MLMDIRLTGTKEECEAFTRNMLSTMPEGSVRSVSGWHRNERKGYSIEGRVYVKLDDEKINYATPRIGKEEEHVPRKGTCYHCRRKGDLFILNWNGGEKRYEGYCAECAKRYLDDQTVGMVTREEEPGKYEAIRRTYSSDIRDHVYFMGGNGEGFWI